VLREDAVVLDKMDWWQTMDVELPHHSAEEAASSALHLPVRCTHGKEIDVPAASHSGELEAGAVTDGDGSAAWNSGRARSAGKEQIPGCAEVRIIATPAQHNTQRFFNDRNTSLWSGFAIESSGKRFFFSGDTGYQTVPKGEEEAEHERDDPTVPVPRPVCPAFKQAGAALGPFDACALPIGAYSPRWFMSTVHADTCDAMRMHMELRSKRSVGMHWGTFQLTDEPLLEPIERLEAAAAKMGQTGRFTAEPLGQTLELGDARA
jgi:L-ascorbate metabolism protein UlaG (beta-lactamase superfamily)